MPFFRQTRSKIWIRKAWVLAALGRHELHAVIGELGDRSLRSLKLASNGMHDIGVAVENLSHKPLGCDDGNAHHHILGLNS